jgi:hexulose-6-phosphate isomerase
MQRREFLGAGILTAAMAADAPAAQKKKRKLQAQAVTRTADRFNAGKRKKAVKLYMVQGNQPLAEKFKLLKKLGYDGVELDGPSSLERNAVLSAREESGLAIHGVVDSVHWSKPLSDPDPKVQEAGVEGLKRAIEDAKAYGASTVLLVPAVVNDKVTYRDAWQRSQENIFKVLPFAQENGIRIALENVWNKFLLSPLEFARYIDEFRSDWIGAYFDIGNVVEFGFPQHWIKTLGARILKIDVKEYGRKERFGYKLGDGDINWPAVRRALDEIGYQGFCTAEIPGGDEAYLADVAGRMNRLLGI